MSRLPLVWCELVCRSCAGSHDGRWLRAGAPVPGREMLNDALRAGWRRVGDEIVCSAVCETTYRDNLKSSCPTSTTP